MTVRVPDLNVARVADRVAEGGHDVPTDRVLARRVRSQAAFPWFAEHAHCGLLIDNTGGTRPGINRPLLIAEKRDGEQRWHTHRSEPYPELMESL